MQLAGGGAAALLASGCSTERPRPAVGRGDGPQPELFERIPLGDTRLGGELGRRIDDCIVARIFAQNADRLVEPFRHRNETSQWQTEFWGKWVLSAVKAYRYQPDPARLEKIIRSARAIVATQSPDGYIGNYAPGHHLQAWDVWGRKYTLLGLLACHDLTGEKQLLTAASRLADHLLTEVGPGKADIIHTGLYRGMASSSILQPMVRLYHRTGRERYLEFAEYIVGQWSEPDGPRLIEKALAGVPVAHRFPPPKQWWSWENGQKAYEMLSCYEGLLELYRTTGHEPHREAVVRVFDDVLAHEILAPGSGSQRECWFDGARRQAAPGEHRMETCVTITWMRYCAALLRLTGEPRFADAFEHALRNALLGALTPNGDSFAKYSPLTGIRELGEKQCGMDLNCCVANGPRGLMLAPDVAVMRDDAGVVMNLYGESDAAVELPSGNRVRLEQRTAYPAVGDVTLQVSPEHEERFRLRLRIPAWSDRARLAVNGEPVAEIASGSYAALERVWRDGDRIELGLDFRARRIRVPGAAEFAVVRGPLLLARDARLERASLDGPAAFAASPDEHLECEPAGEAGKGIARSYRVRLRSGELRLCEYATAGNTWTAESRYRVWSPESGAGSV